VIEPEPWAEDPKLEALLGEQGAERFRTVFDGYPDGVGLLWAIRDDDGRIVDFEFGYGNPSIMRIFQLPRTQRGRFTLLEALPAMRDTGDFDMEAELRGYADMVAHDLREPITGIAHLVALLERRGDEPPSPEVLALLRASTERARELIDGVLAYANAGELSSERVALARLMDEVAVDLRPSLQEAGATLEVGELPEVEGDSRQLRRLLQNLVGNAVKFRGDVAPRVEVSARDGTEGWVVTVRDNGVGIDPEHTTRIFGMFSRLNGDTEGSGIGLAVCRRVVEAHGGRIWVEQAEGGGSAFRFTLPR